MKTIMTTLYSIVIGSLWLTASLASAQEEGAPAKEGASETAPPAKAGAATKTIKKKITKVKSAAGEAAGEVAAAGEEGGAPVGRASKQEPKAAKYGGEVQFQFGYYSGSGSSKPSTEGADETKTTTGTMSLATTYQFILGHIGVGPMLQYSSTAVKGTTGTDSSTTTSTSTGLGLAAEYFIFDVQTEKMVPFVGFNYLITSGSDSTKPATGDEQKTTNSGNQMGLGGGIKYFLARHVSLDPALWYVMTASTTKYSDSSIKKTGNDIRLVATLSTYF